MLVLSPRSWRVFDQDFAVADDGVQRGAQFVAHVGEERRLGAGGGLRLGPALLGLLARRADLAGILAEHRERAAHVAEFVRTGSGNRRRQVALRDRQHAARELGQSPHDVVQHELPDHQDRQEQARERNQDEPPPALGDLVHRPVGGLARLRFGLLHQGLDLIAKAGARLLQRVLERVDLLDRSQLRFAGVDQAAIAADLLERRRQATSTAQEAACRRRGAARPAPKSPCSGAAWPPRSAGAG